MESQRLGEVFNSLSANINVRSKKHHLHIFVGLTFVLFCCKAVGAKECPVGPFYVVHPCVSAEDLTKRMALVKKLEEDLNNSCPPQKRIIKSE